MFKFDRLRDLAMKQGITITHLCKIVEKKNSYIADSQNKGISIPVQTVQIWADALHTTPAYLLGETDDPSEGKKNKPILLDELAPEDRVLIERIRAASPEKKAAILALLKDY